MSVTRVRTENGLYRDVCTPASSLMRVLIVFFLLLMGAAAGILVSIYTQVRMLLFVPVVAFTGGEFFVAELVFIAVFGAAGAVGALYVYHVSMRELRRSDTERARHESRRVPPGNRPPPGFDRVKRF